MSAAAEIAKNKDNTMKKLFLIFLFLSMTGCKSRVPNCTNTLEPACKQAWLNYYVDTIKENNKNRRSEYPYFYDFSELSGPEQALIGNPGVFACKTGGERTSYDMPRALSSEEKNDCISLDNMHIYRAIVQELLKKQ